MGLLDGKVALVTGAGRGIGWEIAKRFASEGAKLVLNDLGCDRNGQGADPSVASERASELRATGQPVLASHHSVTDSAAVGAMVEEAVEQFGTLDILVNNAGIIDDASLFDMTDAQWEGVLATHLRGTFLCSRAVARVLRKQKKGGSILNMTGISGLLGNVGQLNESTAKAGIYGLTRTASIELQKYGISVNALAAIAKTRLTEDLPMFEKVEGSLEAKHVAPAAVYLVSDLCEGLSGTVLSVAGGRLSTYRLAESEGRIKEVDGGVWTPEEIAEHYESISR